MPRAIAVLVSLVVASGQSSVTHGRAHSAFGRAVVGLISHVVAAVAACLVPLVSIRRALARSYGRAQQFARLYMHVEDPYVYVAIQMCN